MILLVFLVSQNAFCSIIVVVNKNSSTSGRPFIWKTRDFQLSPREEIKYQKSIKNGTGDLQIGYLKVIGETELDSNNETVSGGVNDYGFAIANDSVVEDPEREIYSSDHMLVSGALETCRDLNDFENFLKNWENSVSESICDNFAVIDANGGAAIYEIWSDGPGKDLMWKKYDANKSENGFLLRTDSHHSDGWVNHEKNVKVRYDRANQLLLELFEKAELSPRKILQKVAKDVGGDCDKKDPGSECAKYGYKNKDLDNFDTTDTLSRNISTSAFVIEGAETLEDLPFVVIFCAFGEPSMSPVVPYFLFPQKVSFWGRSETFNLLGYAVNLEIGSFLGETSEEILLEELYDNNRKTNYYDHTINYRNLLSIQDWVFKIENFIFDKTEEYVIKLRENSDSLTQENLYNFSHACAKYTYKNYKNRSSDFYPWEFDENNESSNTFMPFSISEGEEVKDVSSTSTNGGCFIKSIQTK